MTAAIPCREPIVCFCRPRNVVPLTRRRVAGSMSRYGQSTSHHLVIIRLRAKNWSDADAGVLRYTVFPTGASWRQLAPF